MALQLAGEDGLLQPIFQPANVAVADLHNVMVGAASDVGLGDTMVAVVKLGGAIGPSYIGLQPNGFGDSNLVTDVLNAPDTLLTDGAGTLVDQIGSDVEQVLPHLTGDNGLVDTIISGDDPLNPVPDILNAIGTTPLITAGDSTGNGDGLIVGDLQNSESGHLIDLELGPAGAAGTGVPINVLATPDGASPHTVELNVLDVGANGPTLLDGTLLSDGSLFSSGDSLIGDVLDPLGGDIAGSDIADGFLSVPVGVVEDVVDLGGGGLLGGGFTHGLLQDVA